MNPRDKPGRRRMGYVLWQTQHAVSRAFDERLSTLGISLTQTVSLLHLRRAPGLTGAELARQLQITPQSTATLLAQLENRAWVTRRVHPVHRNLVEAELTVAGSRLLDEAVRLMDEVDNAVVAGLDTAACRELEAALDHCMRNALALQDKTDPHAHL